MLDGGHIKGFAIPNEHEEQVCKAVNGLASKEAQEEKYGPKKSPLVFAVGDGNHSLATAKSVWEEHKKHGMLYHMAASNSQKVQILILILLVMRWLRLRTYMTLDYSSSQSTA